METVVDMFGVTEGMEVNRNVGGARTFGLGGERAGTVEEMQQDESLATFRKVTEKVKVERNNPALYCSRMRGHLHYDFSGFDPHRFQLNLSFAAVMLHSHTNDGLNSAEPADAVLRMSVARLATGHLRGKHPIKSSSMSCQ